MKKESRSKLLVIEGLDGSGKATQAALLAQRLKEQGLPVRQLSFPNYEDDSSALVRMYLQGQLGQAEEVNAYAASLFYTVDRYATFRKSVQADWERGCIFVADRYTTSNMVHQCTKEPRENWDAYLSWLEDLEYEKVGLPRPDKVIYLDLEPALSQQLLEKRYGGDPHKKDIHEANAQYLLHCRESALYAAEKFGWSVLHCGDGGRVRSVEDIGQELWQQVQGLFSSQM